MGLFKEFYLTNENNSDDGGETSLLNRLGWGRFEVHYDGKVLGTVVAKDSKSALGKAKLKWFGKDGFSGNEPVKVKLIKD